MTLEMQARKKGLLLGKLWDGIVDERLESEQSLEGTGQSKGKLNLMVSVVSVG